MGACGARGALACDGEAGALCITHSVSGSCAVAACCAAPARRVFASKQQGLCALKWTRPPAPGSAGVAAPKRRRVDETADVQEMPKWLEVKPTGVRAPLLSPWSAAPYVCVCECDMHPL